LKFLCTLIPINLIIDHAIIENPAKQVKLGEEEKKNDELFELNEIYATCDIIENNIKERNSK
jgi:hypothetical protein